MAHQFAKLMFTEGVKAAQETHGQEIADLMRDFLNRRLPTRVAAD